MANVHLSAWIVQLKNLFLFTLKKWCASSLVKNTLLCFLRAQISGSFNCLQVFPWLVVFFKQDCSWTRGFWELFQNNWAYLTDTPILWTFFWSHPMLLPMSLGRQLLVLSSGRNSRKDFYGNGIHILKMASFFCFFIIVFTNSHFSHEESEAEWSCLLFISLWFFCYKTPLFL